MARELRISRGRGLPRRVGGSNGCEECRVLFMSCLLVLSFCDRQGDIRRCSMLLLDV